MSTPGIDAPLSEAGNNPSERASSRFQLPMVLGALGIVYGDIGTSPLYAVRQSVLALGGQQPGAAAVYGSISLIFWSLIILVTLKYICFVLRADNKGEGGSFALATFAHQSPDLPRWLKKIVTPCAAIGFSLFIADALLTPAISVLSAVEGLQVNEPALTPWILPLSLAVLVGLFMLQYYGTARVGRLFGPIILVWFLSLGIFGLVAIIETPQILDAVNPAHGVSLFLEDPATAFMSLGAIVLAVTGAEALYADIGHFGASPIRQGWIFIVLPALCLNYFGQGAIILHAPETIAHPFYSLAAGMWHYPMVLLATLATIIASQAVISAVFSITQQAVQLGILPRMEVRHMSADQVGQVFVPRANLLMLAGVVLVVLIFENSDSLATAYGVAVTAIFVLTTFLVSVVALKRWQWKVWQVAVLFGIFAIIDLAFFSSTMLKITEGAWLPILMAIGTMGILHIWQSGRRALTTKIYGTGLSVSNFIDVLDKNSVRIAGTAVFVTPRLDEVPGALLHNMKHNHVLHERIVFLKVEVENIPFVPQSERLTIEKLGKGFFTIEMRFGFFERQNVPAALATIRNFGLSLDMESTTFFIRRDTLVRSSHPTMRSWQTIIFMKMYASALDAARFFGLPPGRVVELGAQTEI
jgi:KUP system potassium uptake protein